MGTRATLTVYDDPERTKIRTQIARSMDGYPSKAGRELVNCLRGVRLTNGYTLHWRDDKGWANGIGHLAAIATGAWLVGTSRCYVLRPENWGTGADWAYSLYPESHPGLANQETNPVEVRLRVSKFGEIVWDGLLAHFTTPAIEACD